MLSLDSARWSELLDAYGPADLVPDLLRELPSAPIRAGAEAQPWFELWSRLCHQGDVYSASYAALPHIVAAAKGRAVSERAEYLVLAGSIASLRHRPRAPAIPSDLAIAYDRASTECVDLALGAIQAEGDLDWVPVLLAALAAFKGAPQLAAALDAIEPQISCPKCGAEVATPGFDLF